MRSLLFCVPVLALVTGCHIDHETVSETTGAGGSGGAGGAGGSGGTGGSGGQIFTFEDSGTDVCPGEPIDLTAGDEYVLLGTTAGLVDDYTSWCGDVTPEVDSADIVYALTLPEDGTLLIEAESETFDPVMVLRNECEATDADLCFDYSDLATEQIVGHFPAGTYYLILDAESGEGGEFRITAHFSLPECGDGVINPAEEQCDPLDPTATDGCTDPDAPTGGCKFEPANDTNDLCPGEAHALTTEGLRLLASEGNTTYGFADDYNGSCNGETVGMAGGVDRVYQITPEVDGTVTATVGLTEDGQSPVCSAEPQSAGCWDMVLYVRTACGDNASELDCSDLDGISAESVTFSATAGTPYWIIVDGFDDTAYSQGPFNLSVTLTP